MGCRKYTGCCVPMFCISRYYLYYYESKADLLSDTIESIWHEIFFHPEDEQIFHDVESCISWIYERLEYGNRQFQGSSHYIHLVL